MSVVVLDTDVASALLRRRTPEATARRLAEHVPAVTFVTIGELDRRLLPGPRPPLATFNSKDFAEHEGLEILPTE